MRFLLKNENLSFLMCYQLYHKFWKVVVRFSQNRMHSNKIRVYLNLYQYARKFNEVETFSYIRFFLLPIPPSFCLYHLAQLILIRLPSHEFACTHYKARLLACCKIQWQGGGSSYFIPYFLPAESAKMVLAVIEVYYWRLIKNSARLSRKLHMYTYSKYKPMDN